MPALLAALLERGRILSYVVEDTAGRLCFCGVTAFARPASLAELALAGKPLRDSLLRLEGESRRVLLSPKGLATANAGGDLGLMHLFGCPDTKDFTSPRGFELHRMGFEAFAFSHGGYQIAEMWQETVVPEAGEFIESQGVPEVGRLTLANGETARWFRFTRQDAAARPGHPLSFLMKFPAPRLGFTRAQQRLLELALLDMSDRQAAEHLELTEAAIKKRWRSIYERLESNGGALAPTDLSGADRRRHLLQYLRQHLEELRPWREPVPEVA